MNRIPMLLAAMVAPSLLVVAAAHAQVAQEPRDPGATGAMTAEELAAEPVRAQFDVPYANTGNPRQRLDMLLPAKPWKGKLPVIVFFHGGGWAQGDKSDGARTLLPLVKTGRFAGISVGYRLSGEATWPAQIHDAKAAIRWIRANASILGLDADRIGVWGRSAGGHLALMLGVSGDVPELEGEIGTNTAVGSRVAAVANFFGASDLPALVGQETDIDRADPKAPEALLIGGALPDLPDKAAAASPITYVTAKDPPVLTVHGTADRIVPFDQAVRLDKALKQAGVPSTLVPVKGAGHGDFGTAADGRLTAFFDKVLHGKKAFLSRAPITKWKP